MVKIAAGKSLKWYLERCCVCDKKFNRTDVRYSGKAIFASDETNTEINVLAHEHCAQEATRRVALEQLSRGEFGK